LGAATDAAILSHAHDVDAVVLTLMPTSVRCSQSAVEQAHP
jgi:hypothetical protein